MNIKANLEFKKRWLQWVLDFIQMDLNSLSNIDRKKLAMEIVYFCGDDLFTIDWEDFEYNASFLSEDRGTLLNEYLKEMEADPSRVQQTLKTLIMTIVEMSVQPDENPILRELPEIHSFLFIGWLGEEPNIFKKGVFNLFMRPQEVSLENWAALNLAKLVNDLQAHSIKKCKGCGRYFLNLSLREKFYCNSSCASRSITRMKYEERKKHPRKYKAYLKKQNEYSMARYRKMRMLQMGPMNVKIGKLSKKRNHKKINRKEK